MLGNNKSCEKKKKQKKQKKTVDKVNVCRDKRGDDGKELCPSLF